MPGTGKDVSVGGIWGNFGEDGCKYVDLTINVDTATQYLWLYWSVDVIHMSNFIICTLNSCSLLYNIYTSIRLSEIGKQIDKQLSFEKRT